MRVRARCVIAVAGTMLMAMPANAALTLYEFNGAITSQIGTVAAGGHTDHVGETFAGSVLFDPDRQFDLAPSGADRIGAITIGDHLVVDTPNDRTFSSVYMNGDRFIGTLPFDPVSFISSNGSSTCAGSGGVTVTGPATMTFSLGCTSGAVRLSGTGTYKAAAATSPAVPEPATWLTMILGFAATGYLMRRRTRLQTA